MRVPHPHHDPHAIYNACTNDAGCDAVGVGVMAVAVVAIYYIIIYM